MISYAQNFEDVVLQRCFHAVDDGRYIDVGAYHPVVDSVTKHFYDRGWSGVNVEPVERFHRMLEQERPRDWNVHAALGNATGTVAFHEWGDSGLSTCHETVDPAALADLGIDHTARQVFMTTLAEVTSRLDGAEVQFLKIDVEGAERDVILGGEWRAFRPRVILVEAIRLKLPGSDRYSFEPAWFDWEGLLFQRGYTFAMFDGLNRWYHRTEEPALHAPLSYPANVTDGFVLRAGHALAMPAAMAADRPVPGRASA